MTQIEHGNLVDELNKLENFSPEERLNHARQRRIEQLDAYDTYARTDLMNPCSKASHDKNIRFQNNIALIEAAARDDAVEVENLIQEHGLSPNLQNEDGLSALHQAVIEDCEGVVCVLVESGADLNIKDADLWTPLHAAVACGNFELVRFLTESGASLVEINTDGNMPIDLVEDNEDIEMYLDEQMSKAGYTEDYLEAIRNKISNIMLADLKDSVENDRSLDISGEQGETAMHIASANGYDNVVEYLLDNGAGIDVVDNDCWQPIHAAACWGQDKIIEILVNHGADLDAVTKDGETPIDLTEDEELQGMIIELKESGHKTRELKRSQSNSSRTLSVRRSSIVEKHKISLNDAKQEGIFRQNPEFLHVVIKTDDDVDEEEGKKNDYSTPSSNKPEKILSTLEQKQVTPALKHNNVNNKKLAEEKINIEPENHIATYTKDSTDINESSRNNEKKETSIKLSDDVVEPNAVDIDLERGEAHSSHNTAAVNRKNKTLTQSTDMSVKKKCCIIL